MKVKWWHTISSLKSEYRSRLTKNLPFIIINKWGEEALKDLFFSNVWCRMLPGAKIIERRFIIAGLFNHRTIIPAKHTVSLQVFCSFSFFLSSSFFFSVWFNLFRLPRVFIFNLVYNIMPVSIFLRSYLLSLDSISGPLDDASAPFED